MRGRFRTSTALIQTLRFHAYNIGHLSSRASEPLFSPCTPAGIIKLLESTGVPISGASTVVLGRSDIVGNPVASMLRNMDATVTQCHRRTKNLEEIVRMDLLSRPDILHRLGTQIRNSDIVVAAIGKANFVKGSWLKKGSVVIDVGINYVPGTNSSVLYTIEINRPLHIRFDKEIWSSSCWGCRVCFSLRSCLSYHPCSRWCRSHDSGFAHGEYPQICRATG